MTLPEKIKALRNEAGFTQKEMAAQLNITERHYQRLESADNTPTLQVLKHIADIAKKRLEIAFKEYGGKI